MNKQSFKSIIVKAGKVITILRPSTMEQFDIYGATALGSKAYALTGDAEQSGDDYTLPIVDFEGQVFEAPLKGDRLILPDTTQKVIDSVKTMTGLAGIVYGFKCRVIG